MRKLTKQYVFQQVYDAAALVEACVEDVGSFIELGWHDPEVLQSVGTFSKITILHRYIFAILAVEHGRDYRKNSDVYEEAPEMIANVESVLRAYEVDFIPYDKFDEPVPEGDDRFYTWFVAHEDQFAELWEKMTDEVFHLLFANRAFLLKFNVALAKYIRENVSAIPAALLTDNGTVKRAFMPKWVRDAVFFRDHGRCVFCHADLSGLLSLDRLDHFDHIVPLAAGGVNDPTNVQLLCEACNLKKSASQPKTGLRYPAWWPE
jgi:hypothetical protein